MASASPKAKTQIDAEIELDQSTVIDLASRRCARRQTGFSFGNRVAGEGYETFVCDFVGRFAVESGLNREASIIDFQLVQLAKRMREEKDLERLILNLY